MRSIPINALTLPRINSEICNNESYEPKKNKSKTKLLRIKKTRHNKINTIYMKKHLKGIQAKANVTREKFSASTMYSLKRSQCNRSNVISTSKIGAVKKRLKQINREDEYYATGLFRSYGPHQA